MKINGYSFGSGLGAVHTGIEDTELEDVIDAIVEELQAFESMGRVFDTITFDIVED